MLCQYYSFVFMDKLQYNIAKLRSLHKFAWFDHLVHIYVMISQAVIFKNAMNEYFKIKHH